MSTCRPTVAQRPRRTYRIVTDFDTVTGDPEKGGTLAERMRAAIQPPARVPAKMPPARTELVTRPDGANVTMTLAVPAGSPSCRQLDALAAALDRAARAAAVSKEPAFELAADFVGADVLLFAVEGAAVFPTNDDLLLDTVDAVPVVLLAAGAVAAAGAAAAALISAGAGACSFAGTL